MLSSPIEIVGRELARQEEVIVTKLMGVTFRRSVRVAIVKPRWMPEWAYIRLMRSIVIESRPLTVETK